MSGKFKKGDTVFYIGHGTSIVQAKVITAHKDGGCKVEAQFFFYEGKACGPYIGDKYEIAAERCHVSALAADYEIQSKMGLTL